jgi:hypothetical protein
MSDFDRPINEWQNEKVEIPVITPEINSKGQVTGMKQGVRVATQKTLYSHVGEPQRISCNDKQHNYTVPDPHIHEAICGNCKKRKFIRAVYEMVKDGKILNRDTGEQID